MQFSEFPFHKSILEALKEERFHTPTKVQEKAIPVILDKKNVIVAAQTGTGKTAAFALPIIQMLISKQEENQKKKKINTLIVTPTRELAIQIEENFKSFTKHTNLITTAVFGGVSLEPQKDILKNGIDILVATPGRLIDLQKQGFVELNSLEIFVLDEADLMLDMGFINDVKKIEKLCPVKNRRYYFLQQCQTK